MPESSTQTAPPLPARSVYAAMFLVSCSTLLLEIGLTRIYSYTIWYHFAFIVIAIALLGFGAAGSALVLIPAATAGNAAGVLSKFSARAAFAVAGLAIFATYAPINPFHWSLSAVQGVLLVLLMAVSTVPFVFAGATIAMALRSYSAHTGRLYFWDLAGSGLGCLAFTTVMDGIGPGHLFTLCCVLYAAAALALRTPRRLEVALLVASLVTTEFVARTADFRPAVSKLAFAYTQRGGRIIDTSWTAIFRTDVYDFGDQLTLATDTSLSIYGAQAGGVGAGFNQSFPPYRFIAHDGDASAIMVRAIPAPDDMSLFRHHILGAAYHLQPNADVFIGGVGGGIDVLAALSNGARHITGVELDPQTADIVCRRHADYVGRFCDRPDVDIEIGDARSALSRKTQRYDIIQFTGVDTITSSAAGSYMLSEGYLYTIEAFGEYLDHLNPGGVIAFTSGDVGGTWGMPRMIPRIASVAASALEKRGVREPWRHVVVIGSSMPADHMMVEGVVLTKAEPFQQSEIARLRSFAEREGFALWHVPGWNIPTVTSKILRTNPSVRRNLLDQFHLDLSAVTDDRPFFMHFYKWSRLGERTQVGPRYVEATGNIVLLFAMALSLLASLVLIVWPARRYARNTGRSASMPLSSIIYFASIGVGFMFIEVSLIQRLSLFLGYPTYSLTVTLFSMLTFAALGSLLTQRIERPSPRVVYSLFGGLALVVGSDGIAGASLLASLAHLALPARIAITVALLAPAGLLLGTFFPIGVRDLGHVRPNAVPIAWAANGTCSVVGTVSAAILATITGFQGVMLVALGLYLVAALAFHRSRLVAQP